MPASEAFLDTNVLLYLLSAETDKADRAEKLIAKGGVVSVQVLNEFVAVAMRKAGLTVAESREVLRAVRASCRVAPLEAATHDRALDIAAETRVHVYDATIIAAAQESGCKVLHSEDMQHGQKFGALRISNPFRS